MASVSLRRSWTPGESRFTQEQWEVTSHLLRMAVVEVEGGRRGRRSRCWGRCVFCVLACCWSGCKVLSCCESWVVLTQLNVA